VVVPVRYNTTIDLPASSAFHGAFCRQRASGTNRLDNGGILPATPAAANAIGRQRDRVQAHSDTASLNAAPCNMPAGDVS
jgi:hypothetical protein